MDRNVYSVILGVVVTLVLWGGTSDATVNKYVEDFTTTQYQDTLNTTAWWDTMAGELKLFPFVLTLAGSYDTSGYAWGVAISGDYAYVADEGSGLLVIDISDPTAPSLAGSYDTPDGALGVAISGDYAYVADFGSGLQVIDISDPTAPSLAGSYDTPGVALGVALSGDYAYVGDFDSGLRVIDISDPTAPTHAGSYNTPGNASSVAVSGDYAYLADRASGLQVIDISDPSVPTSAMSYDTPGSAYNVAISGEYAFVADYISGLQVIKISDPAAPAYAGSYATTSSARGVAVSGDYAFVADYSSGLQVIMISDPTAPSLAGSYNTPGYAWGVVISGDYAYVADDASGLQVIMISDPTAPTYAGSYDTPGTAYGVAISGDYAYVADHWEGLQVIDISDPAAPSLAGSYATTGPARGVAISGDYAYVANFSIGLQVIMISDPTAPTYAGSYDTPGNAASVAISGDYAYVADFSYGLQVIDISDPAAPSLAGSYDTPGTAYGVAISGDYAYVADFSYGLQVIDISNPAAPSLAGSYVTTSYADGVAVSGDYAYVADGGSGLQVLQVFQREFDMGNNVGWALAVDAASDTIIGARLTSTQTNAVTWELSADGGAGWQGIAPDGSWNQLAVPGVDLLWRSTHLLAAPGVNPAVTQLEIDWLIEAALIDSIVDVPGDQGGWVRAHFTRSGRDFSGEPSFPIDDYGIWQRVNDPALIAALSMASTSEPKKGVAGEGPRPNGLPIITHEGNTYIQSGPALAFSSFPPGTWEWVATFPAIQQDDYVARVPTAADSSGSGTNYAVFVVTAHTTTPSIWYISEPDSGYSLDNIAPEVPLGFAVAYNTGSGNALSWDPCPDEDFQYFCVYRSNDPDFDPTPEGLVHTTTTTSWSDPEYDGWNVYYKITACDYVGNESDPASAGTTTAIIKPVIPQAFAVYQNVPNPFNPTTAIRYDVPAAGGKVALRVYDVSGRLVRTLLEGTEGPGAKTVMWDGRNDRGQTVSSGVYFYRMTAPGYEMTHKMVLLQ